MLRLQVGTETHGHGCLEGLGRGPRIERPIDVTESSDEPSGRIRCGNAAFVESLVESGALDDGEHGVQDETDSEVPER
jgi:hypothetical protein